MDEIWNDVKGFVGTYQVSNFGRVKRIIDSNGNPKETIMYVFIEPGIGYPKVLLTTKSTGKRKAYTIHRLVAKAFIPNPENKKYVNHIDSNKTNNKVENLEWCTNSENQIHAFKFGNQYTLRGEDNGAAKLTEKQAIEIYNSTLSKTELSKKFNVSRRIVRMIKLKQRWKHIHKEIA